MKNREESINSSGIPNNPNSSGPIGENTMREKFDRRSHAKTTRKRDNSQDNTRESSCTNRKNREKSL